MIEDLIISQRPTVWSFVAVFGRGRIELPRKRVAQLAAATLAYLANYEPEAVAAIIQPYVGGK